MLKTGSARPGRPGHLALALALGLASCSEGPPDGDTPPDPNATPVVPFEAASPATYVAKVKGLLVGLPPTDAELASVLADPQALGGLIDGWMEQPEFRDKALAFFRNAFQQGQLSIDDLDDQLPDRFQGTGNTSALLLLSLQESFPRTAWQIAAEGRPLTEAVTTRRFMLTPPLMTLLAYLDASFVDDNQRRVSRILQKDPMWSFSLVSGGAPIPLEQTLDPASPNYMKWQNGVPIPPECASSPLVVRQPRGLFYFLFGAVPLPNNPGCQNYARGQSLYTDADFADWRMVTIRQPKAGEETTPFYDVTRLRKANELVLRVPRLGFFSTPAFFANWQTNSSNQARVTMNQTLIVALGKSFDDTNTTVPVSEDALSKDHAGPGTVCYGCHRALDPMRQFFRQAYTLYYHEQNDPKETALPGVFAFDGVSVQGRGIGDLAAQLAQHPRFAAAWTQKLCYYANSAPCIEDDPEFLRVAAAFKASGYKWKTLVRELYASPLTTAAADTKTFQERGVVINVSRRDHLCVALSERLGIDDVCGISGRPGLSAPQRGALVLANGMPADGYSRGSEAPLLANDPSLFFRGAVENLCRVVADQVVDNKMRALYSSAKADEAISAFVHNLMGLPAADGRAAEVEKVLHEHLDAAKKGGATPTDALKSTFVLACESPPAVSIGL